MYDDEQSTRERAYFLWQKEGSPDNRDAEFWERAALMQAASAEPLIDTPLEKRTPDEKEVDEAMKETFPASDAPAFAAKPKPSKRK